MKKLVICVAVLAMVWTSSAMAVPVALVNASFEDPGYHKQVNGFDGEIIDPGSGALFPDVPGWEDDCTRDWPRSGVIGPVHAVPSYDGDYRAFLYFDDTYAENVVYQLTDQTIAADKLYTLNAWGLSGGVVPSGTNEKLQLSFFYVDGVGDHIELASKVNLLPDDSPNYHLCDAVFFSDDMPDSIGEKLGIKFTSLDVGCTAAGWLGFDDVSLDVIPEPATMMLLGLGSLALLKRRRA